METRKVLTSVPSDASSDFNIRIFQMPWNTPNASDGVVKHKNRAILSAHHTDKFSATGSANASIARAKSESNRVDLVGVTNRDDQCEIARPLGYVTSLTLRKIFFGSVVCQCFYQQLLFLRQNPSFTR